MDPPNMKGDLWCRVWCQYKFTAPTLARGVRINCTRKRPRLAENTWMGTGVLHRYLTTSTASASRESLQTFGNSHSSLPKERVDVPPLHMSYEEPSISYSYDTSHFNAFSPQQIDCAYTGIMAEQNSDTKSIGGQFVEEFNVKIDSLTEKICRDVEEKFNSYILNEFCAKEVDEQQDDRARNLENTEEMLEGHKGTNQDIIQVNKSPCFSNTSDKKIQSANNEGRLHFATPRKSYAKDNRFDKRNRSRWSSRQKSSAWVGGSSIRKQIWVLKSRGQDMGLAAHDLQADALVGVQMA
uniref:Uncharacterized protein n=1 Tax=Oryza rufipogon TaxID=4529 RepID=A0A0E0QVK5_ORYRU